MLKTFKDITHTIYINLESRPDRREHVESQLASLGIKNPHRFNAIKMEHGMIGCSMSHIECIKIAKKNNWPHVFICEDDILFLNPDVFIENFNKFLQVQEEWDVILVAGNVLHPYKEINEYGSQVYNCQTTTGYIIKNTYYDILLSNITEGVKNLQINISNHGISNIDKYFIYAIDQYWKHLQKQHLWFIITPLSVIQREDYSDIEQRDVNYIFPMLTIDKF